MRSNTHVLMPALAAAFTLAGCDSRQQQAEIERLKDENAALARQVESGRAAQASAQTNVGELTEQVKQFAARVASLTEDLQAGRELAAAAQAKFDEASRLLTEAQDEVTALRASLQKTLADASEASQRYEAEIDRLQAQVTDLAQKLAEATRNLNPDRLRDLLPGQDPRR